VFPSAAAYCQARFLSRGEQERRGKQEGEIRRVKKEFMKPLQDSFDPLQIQV
jgi:hypothetical protein